MKKQLSAIFMLAGTAIGSGMISLPIVLSHIGMIPAFLLIIFCSIVTYFSALIRTELNLHSQSNFTLEHVGLKFSGKTAGLIGNISLKLLSFSLLSAYIYGLSSIISSNDIAVKIIVAIVAFSLMAFSSQKIIVLNRRLFAMLIITIIVLILFMLSSSDLRLISSSYGEIHSQKLFVILPTLFTSFGYQGSLHTLTSFCNNDQKLIQRSCLVGSLIPAIVYILWTFCIMTLIFSNQPDLFFKMSNQGIDINELIDALCGVSGEKSVKIGTFIISMLAIITSVLGVGLALIEDLEMAFEQFKICIKKEKVKRWICSALAIFPSAVIAIIIPEAFVKILSFAGMILSIIAIFLPSFLFFKIKEKIMFSLLNVKYVVPLVILFGIAVVLCEIMNLFI
jgi:tyrosine-specific transport protein